MPQTEVVQSSHVTLARAHLHSKEAWCSCTALMSRSRIPYSVRRKSPTTSISMGPYYSPGSPGRAASFDHRSTRRLVAVMSQGHPAFLMLERRIIEIRDWVNCGKSKQSAARLRLEKNRPGGECVPGPSSHSHHGDKSTDVEQVQRVALRGLSARRPC